MVPIVIIISSILVISSHGQEKTTRATSVNSESGLEGIEQSTSTIDWPVEDDDFWTERTTDESSTNAEDDESLSQVTTGSSNPDVRITTLQSPSAAQDAQFQTSIIFTNLFTPDDISTTLNPNEGSDTTVEATTLNPIVETTAANLNQTSEINGSIKMKKSKAINDSAILLRRSKLFARPPGLANIVPLNRPTLNSSLPKEVKESVQTDSSKIRIQATENDLTEIIKGNNGFEVNNKSSGTINEYGEKSSQSENEHFSTYETEQVTYLGDRHPCLRECLVGSPNMTCEYNFRIEWYNTMSKACFNCPYNISDCYLPHCVAADGVKRTIATINRRIPGPPIEVCQGDRIVVRLENRMMESTTTLHWHGQHQRISPYMDGVPYVTQCPIQPGSSFVYSFIAENPGTHFYHSHSGIQRGDGAFGALIVRKPQITELFDMDLPEHTMIVLDWSHQLGTARFTDHHHAGGNNKPDTLQINGRGVYAKFDNNTTTPPASFTVTKGFRYRFRLINAGVLNCPIEISIDDHKLLVISSDGNDILPETVDTLVSYAGERWDFVVSAGAVIGNYWIKVRGLMDCDERFTSAYQAAVLHYSGAPSQLPTGKLDYQSTKRGGKILNALNVGRLDPSTSVPELEALSVKPDPALTPDPDHRIVLSYDFYPLDNPDFHKSNMYGFNEVHEISKKTYTPQLNHISLKLPPFPLLSQNGQLKKSMLCKNFNQTECASSYCECTNIIEIKLGHVVEIILIDEGVVYDANHPFHLHGHSFRVISMDKIGHNVTTRQILDMDAGGQIYRNLNNPPIKDTVTVPDGGYTIIRFVANNPGYWLFHCHIEFHVEVGMALVFKIGDNKEMLHSPPHFPTCGDYDPDEDLGDDIDDSYTSTSTTKEANVTTTTAANKEQPSSTENNMNLDENPSVNEIVKNPYYKYNLTGEGTIKERPIVVDKFRSGASLKTQTSIIQILVACLLSRLSLHTV